MTLNSTQQHHLFSVLRQPNRSLVTYGDGQGRLGLGILTKTGVERGEEHYLEPSLPIVDLLVASPTERNRVRFLVEKCTELGVRNLTWIRTETTPTRFPPSSKANAWAVTAFEQSHGSYLLQISDKPIEVSELTPDTVFCVPSAPAASDQLLQTDKIKLAVGPPSGWTTGQLSSAVNQIGLGPNVLRTETAAIVAASLWRYRADPRQMIESLFPSKTKKGAR